MGDYFTRQWKGPVNPKNPARALRPALKPLTMARAEPGTDCSVIRPYVNDEQNSRMISRLGPIGQIKPRWTFAPTDGQVAGLVFLTSEYVISPCSFGCYVLDRKDGRMLH